VNAARAGVLSGLTVASGVAVLLGPPAASVPGGLLLGLVLPGAALVGALFRRRRDDLGVVERLVLVPALSLATLVLGGLLLWAVGGTLNQVGWLGISAATTLVAVVVAVARERWGTPVDDAEPAAGSGRLRLPRLDRSRLVHEVLPLVLSVGLLAGFGVYSYRDSVKTYDMSIVAFSASPPGPAGTDGNRAVVVKATGLARTELYTLIATDSVGEQIDERSVVADTHGIWTATLSLPADQRVTVSLLKGATTTAYREVIIAAETTAQ
jgi:hypothetical protein